MQQPKGRIPCEFYLVRYVPDPVKDEFVNIGVLLREAGRPESAMVRFTRDWGRVRCADPGADVEWLEAVENEVRERLAQGPVEVAAMMRVLEENFSNLLQMSGPKACLAESVVAELERLSSLYVETRRAGRERRRTGRQGIVLSMRRGFEAAGVWGLMRKRIAASLYTRPGDPLRIDCGYRPNGVVRMFQAVSLEGDLEAAKVLAFSAPQLVEGVARVEKAKLELTAIVEPLRSMLGKDVEGALEDGAAKDQMEQYRFGVETMERSQVRVLTVLDLERVAETARRELRV
ncbi:MAG: DUF3037 domain-containing protein [Acidobacteriaceae bacterium]